VRTVALLCQRDLGNQQQQQRRRDPRHRPQRSPDLRRLRGAAREAERADSGAEEVGESVVRGPWFDYASLRLSASRIVVRLAEWRAMATPLAGASVERGVEVELTWKHGEQRG
jgi:hypothetical protein